MNFLESVILGIIEGITEFLPISSTLHLDISRLLLDIPATNFVKSFEIIIQFGAILSVVYLYRGKMFSSVVYFKQILIAFIPTGVVGFVLYKTIKYFFLGNTLLSAIVLILGGLIMLIFERRRKNQIDDASTRSIENLSIKELIILGFAQALAVIPGVSRSGAVIISGRALSLPKSLITEFSFLLAVPTMLSATMYDLYKTGASFENNDWMVLLVGSGVSFVVALFVVKWLIEYVKNNSFNIFGWYRIIIGVLILVFLV
ncbi:MAG: undecaprenyl-diphosphatase [Patescibacteria group bacterium]|nr:undecaprenyl-diphosphatase [Patescibacteria group bacterium]